MKEKIPHYMRVASLVKKRILHGDYSIQAIPSERQLARELDVNYMTVRRGLQLLVEDGLIERLKGKMRVKSHGTGVRRQARVALLVPTLTSSRMEEWRSVIDMVAASRGISVRTVLYVHWDDPVVVDSVQGFDGAFVVPAAEPVSAEVLKCFQNPTCRVVMLDHGFNVYGLPSILQFPPACVHVVLDHLASLGKTRIACFNSQPEHEPVLERIDQWRFWMAAHEFRGPLYNRPVRSGEMAAVGAYQAMREILRKGLDADAVLCITMAAAMGAIRALADCGRMPGRELPLAAVNGEGIAEVLTPTLTCLKSPDIAPYLRLCLDWMLAGDEPWTGPLLMAPTGAELFVGESTLGVDPVWQ